MYASPRLFAATHSQTRLSFFVDRCGSSCRGRSRSGAGCGDSGRTPERGATVVSDDAAVEPGQSTSRFGPSDGGHRVHVQKHPWRNGRDSRVLDRRVAFLLLTPCFHRAELARSGSNPGATKDRQPQNRSSASRWSASKRRFRRCSTTRFAQTRTPRGSLDRSRHPLS